MYPIVILFLGGIVLTIGDIVMKKWTINNTMYFYILGMFIYMIGLNFLAYSFKFKGIAVASVLFIVFNVVTLSIVGWLAFNESLSLNKFIGIVLALVAVVVLEIS